MHPIETPEFNPPKIPKRPSPMGKADLHMHTTHSDGLASPKELLEAVLFNTELSVIAITDHDSLGGALEALEVQKHYPHLRGVEVIVGTEVSSTDGHILGLFLKEPIPPALSAAETVELIHRQGGLAIAAHPFSPAPVAFGMKGVGPLMAQIPFDAAEGSNSSPVEIMGNARTRRFVSKHAPHLPLVGNSDAHHLAALASFRTLFEGQSAEDLRSAIRNNSVSVEGHIWRTRKFGQYAKAITNGWRKTYEARSELGAAKLALKEREAKQNV